MDTIVLISKVVVQIDLTVYKPKAFVHQSCRRLWLGVQPHLQGARYSVREVSKLLVEGGTRRGRGAGGRGIDTREAERAHECARV